MPDATITSTASTFGTISGTFASDQSTITGTITGVVSGTLTGSVGVPGPQGPAGPGSTWGGIAGVLSNQLDLQGALDLKYNASNPAGYQTAGQVSTALAPYITSATATASFYPLTGNPSAFLTASALSPYLLSSTASATYQTLAGMSAYLTTSAAAAGYYPLSGNPSGFLTAASLSGYATESWVTGQGYITSAALSPYLLSSTAASTYQTQSAMSAYLTKADNLASVASTSAARSNLGLGSLDTPTFAGITAQGSGSNVANLTPTSLSLTHATSGSFTIQPSVGIVFPDGSTQVTAFTGSAPGYITSVTSPLSVTSGNLTIDLSAYAPIASPVFTGDARAVTPAFGDNDTSIATTAFVQSALLGGTAVARNLEVEVRNQSGSTIPAGSIVYISGATGNKPLITLAQANNDANSAQTIGFVKTSIANNGTGFVIVRGELENIDTSALTEGVQLYLSPTTAGTWTTTKPSAPQHMVYVGVVIRSHPTLGTILVAVMNGLELEELHNVAALTPANNDLLAYESSTDLWKNKTYSALGLLTSADAASTYQTLAGMSSYLTTSAASTNYVAKSGSAMTGGLTFSAGGYISSFSMLAGNSITIPDGGSEVYETVLQNPGLLIRNASNVVLARFQADQVLIPSAGITFSDATTQTSAGITTSDAASTYQTIAGMSSYAPKASPALTGNVTITSNSTGAALFIEQSGTGNILTLHDQASDTSFVAIDQNGKVNTIASTTTNAGFNVPHGTAPTTPVNGDIWTTTSGLFMRQNGSTKQYVDLDGTQTINGTKTFSASSQTLGNSTATGTISVGTGATLSGSTKTVNIGTGGVAGSTTNIAIGSTTGTSTTTLQGSTVGVTLAADTNTTGLATTAYVVGQAAAATPLIDGTAAVGTSLRYARADHVHPTDTTRAPLNSPTFSGTPSLPTGTTAVTQSPGNNTTAVATTAFVLANAGTPSFAATTDVIFNPSSTTLALNPALIPQFLANSNYRNLCNLTVSQISGSANVTQFGPGRELYTTSTTASGRASWANTFYSATFMGMSSKSNSNIIDWSKKIWVFGTAILGRSTYLGNASTVTRINLGGRGAAASGDITSRGIGLFKVGGTSTFINLTVHNGTTLTNVASSVTLASDATVHYVIYSDGAGNVQLYLDGTLAASTTAGPTGSGTSGHNVYEEQIESATSAGVLASMHVAGAGIYMSR